MRIHQILGGGIQKRLVISFLVLGILPMAVMGAISYYKSSTLVLDQTHSQLNSLVQKATEQLEMSLKVVSMQADHLLLPFDMALNYIKVGMVIDEGTKENLMRENGRGIFLMRTLMDRVEFEKIKSGYQVRLWLDTNK